MRLRTLPVSLAGVVCAVGFNLSDGTFKVLPAAICFVFAFLCQVASNFANEYFDYRAGRDKSGREGPRRGVTEGDISPDAMRNATFGTLILAAVLGLLLVQWGGWWLIAAGAIIGLGALAYSTGPYPLSTHCLGELAVIIFFGIVPVNLTYYVQSLSWSVPVFMASLAIGLLGANVLVVNNTRDIPDDRSVGKHTLATVFGRRAMMILYTINAIAAAALTLPTWIEAGGFWYIIPAFFTGIWIAIALKMSKLYGAAMTPCLGMTAVSMFAYSLLLTLALT